MPFRLPPRTKGYDNFYIIRYSRARSCTLIYTDLNIRRLLVGFAKISLLMAELFTVGIFCFRNAKTKANIRHLQPQRNRLQTDAYK